jgi:hypothetical protein
MTGDFQPALAAFLGLFSPPVSRGLQRRLKTLWLEDHEDFRGLAINPAAYRFFWAQAVFISQKAKDKAHLALIGVTEPGVKKFLGLTQGSPQDGAAWAELFRALKDRGLNAAPKPLAAAPELGVWAGLRQFYGGGEGGGEIAGGSDESFYRRVLGVTP